MNTERLNAAESGVRALSTLRSTCALGNCVNRAACREACKYREQLRAADTSMAGDPLLLRPAFPVLSDAVANDEYRASTERPGSRRELPEPPIQSLREEQIAGPRALVYGGLVVLIMVTVIAIAFISAK